MNNQTANTIKNVPSAIALVLITTSVAALLSVNVNAVGGLFSESTALNTFSAFAQEQQNQTSTITSGNNTNTTTSTAAAAASNFNEMLNPRQKEYPAHLGFNDLHIEAIRHIDPMLLREINSNNKIFSTL
jgi:hypothetical protein